MDKSNYYNTEPKKYVDDFFIKNDKEIIKNENYLINNYEKIYKNVNKIDYYKNVSNFNALFGRRSNRIVSTTPSTPTTTQAVNTPPTTDSTLQGKTYDTSRMWSPQSYAGKIYEWNRGVATIGINGDIEKEVLDGTANHHADATIRTSSLLGVTIDSTTAPFEAAINAANKGLLVFQSEGDNAFVYLPEFPSESQALAISNILLPRIDFNFSFTYKDEIYENVRASNILRFIRGLITDPEMAI